MKTPGQIAYEAWMEGGTPNWPRVICKKTWEAAAAAVIGHERAAVLREIDSRLATLSPHEDFYLRGELTVLRDLFATGEHVK